MSRRKTKNRSGTALVRYGSLDKLEKTWYQHFDSWEAIMPPRARGAYPDSLDWQTFKLENKIRLLRWRLGVLREEDSQHAMIAHGLGGKTYGFCYFFADEWHFAVEVEQWGLTYVPARNGHNSHRNFFQAVDVVRCAARGKPTWLGELQGGYVQMVPQVEGSTPSEGRSATTEGIRVPPVSR